MTRSINTRILSLLKEIWKGEEENETCRIVAGSRVSLERLQGLEEQLGFTFPASYKKCVSEVGLCHYQSQFEDCSPDGFMTFLAPEEIEGIVKYFKEWTTAHTYFDEDDVEEAKEQQAIRDTLIPFQY